MDASDSTDVPESPAGSSSQSDEKEESEDSGMEKIRKYFTEKLKLYEPSDSTKETSKIKKILNSLDLDGIVEYIKDRGCKKIITMAGAGISTCRY